MQLVDFKLAKKAKDRTRIVQVHMYKILVLVEMTSSQGSYEPVISHEILCCL